MTDLERLRQLPLPFARTLGIEFLTASPERVTAEMLGAEVRTLFDVGVAGIHRLLSHRDLVMEARVVIVVAGMEGALASVVGGLVRRPVIAVPPSAAAGRISTPPR